MKEKLCLRFKAEFNRPAAVFAQAPGRLEILGNHTDYNEGIVLSCAVSQRTMVALAPTESGICRLKDFRMNREKTFLTADPGEARIHDWSNYIKGVVLELRRRGFEVGGFDAGFISDVPLSAGMSSSAALEISFALALGKAFGIELPREEWAKVGQSVENQYLGLKTGLLDQFSSLFGMENSLILSDFRTIEVLRTVPLPAGYRIVVVNSMVKHNLVESAYNERRADCFSAMEKIGQVLPQAKTLRDVSPEQLESCRSLLSEREYGRAKHVTGECDRVRRAVSLLEAGDAEGFGALLFESHESSRLHFENSSPEQDLLVQLARETPGCIGSRLSGGGFGGITIHLVEEGAASHFAEQVSAEFKKHTGTVPQVVFSAPGAGASAVAL